MSLRGKNNGFTAVFVALAMPVIIAILGICLDGSILLYYDSKLTNAVKFAAISATSVNIQNEGALEITADNSFVQRVLINNLDGAILYEFTVDQQKKNQCTVKATYEVPFVFMKIFGFESKTILESYSAERNL